MASIAQAEPTETTATEATAADLRISPHFGLDLNTPRNGDNGNSFGRVSAFLPLFQTPGRHLTFISTAGRVDTEGNLGGNVSLGHRFALSRDTVLGGYLAYDVRDTGQNTFSQIGLGAEVMGENWTAQLNGYIPVGDTTVQVGETTSGGSGAGVQFQNNQLVMLVAGGTQMFESALGSVEAGASVKLADLGVYGDLWGFGSAYYVSNTLGGSLQLDHRLGSLLRIGLGAQSDRIFGTQVFASIGTRFGTAGRTRAANPSLNKQADPQIDPQTSSVDQSNRQPAGLWPQLAAADINRNSSILVRLEVQETATETLVAINPETGQAYRFRHVVPDAAAANQGDGTAESPFTTLGSGIADAANTGLSDVSDGEMVYVRSGDSRTNAIAPFTIPAGVQVHSDAIAAILPTQFGDIRLPNSGTGIRPLVNGSGSTGITLSGGNNQISGFEIDGSANGISLNNPSGTVTIENNLISNTTNRALSLAQSTGVASVIVNNNTINTATQDGIRVELTNTADLTLALTNNQINNITASDGDGIDIEANNTSRANLTIANNQINQAGNSGIELETCGNTTTTACTASFSATVTGNTISRSGGDGILFFHNSNQPAQLTIESNQVQQSGIAQTGVTNNAGNPLPVPGNGGFGIMAATFADGDLTLTIENNTVTDSQDEKIAIINNLETNDASVLTSAAPTTT
ncbi:MAG: right-handed parallel beta-helix repeat-containing protein, partial [Phormidesmis sp.]